ncbi:MAG: hypothetical protein H6595_08955 [Flavobacteriales bacterium]|nr:hypothetical protein [Flavobacteriales bacterium]
MTAARDDMLALEGAKLIGEFTGRLDRPSFERVIASVEAHSLARGDGLSVRKRLVGVLVEALENILRHGDQGPHDHCYILVHGTEAAYRIDLGNALPLARAALLLHRIDILNEMDEADIKEHYLKFLANDSRTITGGAGLGLLSIARRCQRPILASSVAITSDQAFLDLRLQVVRRDRAGA